MGFCSSISVFPSPPPPSIFLSPRISAGLASPDSALLSHALPSPTFSVPFPASYPRPHVQPFLCPLPPWGFRAPDKPARRGRGAPPPRPLLTRAQSLQSQSFGSQDEQSRCRQGRTCTRFSRSMNTGPGEVPTTSRLRSCLPRSQKQRHFPQGPRTESSNSRDGGPGRGGTYIPPF